MKIKHSPGDFRVRELLRDGYLQKRGDYHVYRVTKRKLTSLEAAAELAKEAGMNVSDVHMAGLKDRQGITTQYMSMPRGRPVSISTRELTIEPAGFAYEELSARFSDGNAFDITVRELDLDVRSQMGRQVEFVRAQGVPNYFDDQRFGNLKHGQGWIARELMRGRTENALLKLLCGGGKFDDPKRRNFKRTLKSQWGDWRACCETARRNGAHHSVFAHLVKHPGDFAGAFYYIGSRLRLIHLYAYQSHIWNRAVAGLMERRTGKGSRLVVEALEGRLVFPRERIAAGAGEAEAGPGSESLPEAFRLPGPGLEDVTDPLQYELLCDALAAERFVPDHFRIEGVPGFQLKGEDRALMVKPRRLAVRAAGPGRSRLGALIFTFDLPRGAYATLVLRRLLAGCGIMDLEEPRTRESRGERRSTAEGGRRPGGGQGRRRWSGPGGAARSDEASHRRSGTRPDSRHGSSRPGGSRGNRPDARQGGKRRGER